MVLKQADIFGGYKELKTKQKTSARKIKNFKLKQKIQMLYNLYEQLYELQDINILEQRDVIIKNNIICYPQDRQAEPLNTINLTIYDIDERIRIMEQILNDWT